MLQERIDGGGLSYAPCRYDGSKILFRGPRKSLDLPYLAFFGGAVTYGKYIATPYPALVENSLRMPCVNLGSQTVGVEGYLKDPAILDIGRAADVTVVQITGVDQISNRFFRVHPRRVDRLDGVSSVMRAIYPDVDFGRFSRVDDMLRALYDCSTDRFETVVAEMRAAWGARMRSLIDHLGDRVVLLWFSQMDPADTPQSGGPGQPSAGPLFVTSDMIGDLRPLVKDTVLVTPSHRAVLKGTKGMIFAPEQAAEAAGLPGVACHEDICASLVPRLRAALYDV